MKKVMLFFTTLMILSACTPKLEKRLKSEMVAAPTSQVQIDKNLILQYAIDNELDVQSTPSGIYYAIENYGTGDERPDKNSKITAHYHGTLLNGDIFDSSVDRGEPLKFDLGKVIKGWQEAIPMLGKGGKGQFFIPSKMAYGSRAIGDVIPANAVLVFDIELLDFK
ncbi:MAG: FKBP-type peptidyl-prolyl cis-trans isomerase [Saprospiraceae bacterium]